ncbi:peptidase S8/S53 domain-containing protein [Cadophora sp. MPI-SDFR-AT-0126]|nr:peptidase S8/S53 domain-containing protein [Leotiomycetes sp. MPI-SDFR-AT-0126]
MMKYFLSFSLWASLSCISSTALAAKSPFDHGVIIEYEDWAAEDSTALIENVKSTLGRNGLVDVVDVKPRLEISSSIFRGISANVTGVGEGVNRALVQSAIQSLRVVKKVSPINLLSVSSPIDNDGAGMSQNFGREVRDEGLVARQDETTTLSTHVMTGVDKLHSAGIKGKGITIAIMDTGFDYKQDSLGNAIGPGNKVTYGYDWVGDEYNADDANTVAVEDGDPYANCSYHGTHVFGTVGANPTKFGVTGVAPEASFELHRVFGCTGTVSTDVAIKVSIAIYERGVDIITASIGGGPLYPDDPWSVVVSRINQNGTYFQISAGNSGAGYYTVTSPSVGIDVPAIGAVWNTETPYYLWSGTYKSMNETKSLSMVPGGRADFPSTFNIWTASPEELDVINTGCGPYPEDIILPDFNTTAVLVNRAHRSFFSPCSAFDAQNYLTSIGAKYVLFYITQPDDPVTGPTFRGASPNITGVGNLFAADGASLFAAYQKDKSLTVSVGTLSSYNDNVMNQQNTVAGGRMTHFSSWGPTLDGRTSPSYSAPGGNILSTFPKTSGGFGTISGTSMAAPFTAGVAALMMQQHPDWDWKTVRNVLATTANPMQYNDNTTTVYDFLAPVFQQGGGLVDAYRAVNTEIVVDVPSLSFNDTADQPKFLSFKVKNIGSSRLSHLGAASGYGISSVDVYTPLTDDNRELSRTLQAAYATLDITPSEVTIPPGKESTITVSVASLPALDSARLPFYGGYIALNSTDGTQSVTVPYTGIATSLFDIPIDTTGSVIASYNFTSNNATALEVTDSNPTVFNLTYQGSGVQWVDNGNWPAVLVSIRSAVQFHTYKIDLLNSTGDVFIPLANFTNYYQDGNNWYLDGTDGNSTFLPEGEYRFRVGAFRIYGDESTDEDLIATTSEPFIIKYTADSVGLPGSSNSTLNSTLRH